MSGHRCGRLLCWLQLKLRESVVGTHVMENPVGQGLSTHFFSGSLRRLSREIFPLIFGGKADKYNTKWRKNKNFSTKIILIVKLRLRRPYIEVLFKKEIGKIVKLLTMQGFSLGWHKVAWSSSFVLIYFLLLLLELHSSLLGFVSTLVSLRPLKQR